MWSPKSTDMDSSVSFYTPERFAVSLKGRSRPSDTRQSVHILFLIDTSESMNDFNKLQHVKSSMSFIQPLLTPDDRVSIVTFGDSSATLCSNIPPNSQEFIHTIQKITTNGCTNLSAGLMALQPILSADTSTRKKGVLLLTDGHANRGVFDSSSLQTIVNAMIESNSSLTLSSIAYGINHNTDLLKQIATDGNGSYNLVNTLENVATVFGEILGGLTTLVAQNVLVKGPPEFRPLTSYTVDSFSNIHVGDIYSENEIIILFEHTPPAQNTPLDDNPSQLHPTFPSLSVQITGSDMISFSPISHTLSISPFVSSVPVPQSVQIASLRYDVTKILQKAAEGRSVRSEAQQMLETLRALPFVSENIIQMMIDDMEILLERGGLADTIHVRTNMMQHAAYLGLGRGIRSTEQENEDPLDQTWGPSAHHVVRRQLAAAASAATGVLEELTAGTDDESASPLASVPLARTRTAQVDSTQSPFSNRIQSHNVEVMRSASQPHPR